MHDGNWQATGRAMMAENWELGTTVRFRLLLRVILNTWHAERRTLQVLLAIRNLVLVVATVRHNRSYGIPKLPGGKGLFLHPKQIGPQRLRPPPWDLDLFGR